MKVTCPACKNENAAFDLEIGMFICPDCGLEWNKDAPSSTDPEEQKTELGGGD
jgi:uncharacterized Zn ribbon protein